MPPWGSQKKSLFSPAYDQLLKLLREARINAGLTQEQLAKRIGRQHNWVSKCELGERRMDVLEYIEYCEGCRVDPMEMLREIKAAKRRPRQGNSHST